MKRVMKQMLSQNPDEKPEDAKPSQVKPAGLRERKREEKVGHILTASIAVFAEDGYSGFSMRKVAARADVRLNTIQHHFGDLDALLVATIRTMSDNYIDGFYPIADNRDLSALERLEIIIEYLLRDVFKPEVTAFFAEAQSASLHNQKIFAMMREAYARHLDMLARLVKEIDPTRADTEAHVLASMISAWIEGVGVTQRFTPGRSSSAGSVMVRIKAACLSLASNGKAVKDN